MKKIAIAALAAAVLPQAALAQNVPAPVIIVVDSNKAGTECNACKTALTQLQQQGQSLQTLRQQQSTPLQTEQQQLQTAIDALKGKQPDAALQARITAGGRLLFINSARHAIFTDGPERTDILVERVAAAATPAGRWLAEDIRGGGVIDRLQTVLEIAEDGTITGTGGCNRMSGKATISDDGIVFGPIAATSMACTPAAMDQESKFFEALGHVRKWRVDPARRKLALLDEGGSTLIVLARQ